MLSLPCVPLCLFIASKHTQIQRMLHCCIPLLGSSHGWTGHHSRDDGRSRYRVFPNCVILCTGCGSAIGSLASLTGSWWPSVSLRGPCALLLVREVRVRVLIFVSRSLLGVARVPDIPGR